MATYYTQTWNRISRIQPVLSPALRLTVMHVILYRADSEALHSATMLPKILSQMRPLMTSEGVWGVEVSVRAWACLTSPPEALWLGRATVGRLDASLTSIPRELRFIYPSQAARLWTSNPQSRPYPYAATVAWQRLGDAMAEKRDYSFLADLKSHLDAPKPLCVVSGPFLVAGNCSSESHKVIKMRGKYGFLLIFWHYSDTSCIFNVGFHIYAPQLWGFTSPQNY